MTCMAGRPRALTAEQEHQLEHLVDAGIPHEHVARAMGVSRRTVARVLARRRAEREPQTLDELLASIETDSAAILAGPPPSRAMRRRRHDWRASARFLEQNYPERWGDRARE
jgi:transcriptional regulator with XRE-family HTH domain